MKRALAGIFPFLSLVALLIYPAVYGLSRMAGWSYTLRGGLPYALICLALAFAALLFSDEALSPVGRVLSLLNLPAACVCGFLLQLGLQSAWVSPCVLMIVIVSLVLFFKTKMTRIIKIPLGILALIALPPTLMLCLTGFSPASDKTESAFLSPDGAYMAEISVLDENAPNGDTVIWVYPVESVKQGILGEWKREKEIYHGPMPDSEMLSFLWSDEMTLLLNDIFLQIPQ